MRTDQSARRHLGGAQHNEGGRRRGRGKGPGGSARTLSPFGGRAVALVIIYPNGERELVAPVTEAEADALVAHLRLVSPRSTVLRAPCELKVERPRRDAPSFGGACPVRCREPPDATQAQC